ncbi:MAG: amidohydrolase family protein [Gammaproteobacteria bacterium]|nr:amidohydrolase family protein [Gammaproteobacteria bacterium]
MRELPKIDAHHHLWNLDENPYPWLQGPDKRRSYGDLTPICRNYLVEDYLADSSPHHVVKSVHVQANWAADDPVAESAWLQRVSDEHGFPHAIVGYADLTSDDLVQILEAHRAFPGFRGIRHAIGHTDDPHCRRPSISEHPNWARGYAALARFELSFDLQTYPPQMASALKIAARHDRVPFAICHMGFPHDQSRDGRALWRRGLRKAAELPLAHIKLSGPCMVKPDWTVEGFADFVHECIDTFGPQRCMFASNVPPDLLARSFDGIYEAFYEWASRYSEDERREMFHDCAARFYRI